MSHQNIGSAHRGQIGKAYLCAYNLAVVRIELGESNKW
jgi:hypothetical protein